MARKILNALTWLILACMILFAAVLLVPRLMGLQMYAVLTGSMQPAIPAGALVYTEQVQAGQLKQGDVITFRQGSGAVVTHRIVSIDEEGNITTKGDANNVEDQATITAAQVIGRVKFHLPVLGALCEWFKTRTGILTVTGVLIVLILSVFLPEIFSHNGRSAGRKKD